MRGAIKAERDRRGDPLPGQCLRCHKKSWAALAPGGLCDVCRLGCAHERTRRVYEQRPPSEGRKLVAAGRKCEDCGALLALAE